MWKKRKEVWVVLRIVSVVGDNGGFVWGEVGLIRFWLYKDEMILELSECVYIILNNGFG